MEVTSSFPGSLFFPPPSFLESSLLSQMFSQVYDLYPLMVVIKFPLIWAKANCLYEVDNILEASASEKALDLNLWSSHNYPFEVRLPVFLVSFSTLKGSRGKEVRPLSLCSIVKCSSCSVVSPTGRFTYF